MSETRCYLCDTNVSLLATKKDGKIIHCRRCGKYFISQSLIESQDEFKSGKANLYKISSWVYEQNHDFNTIPELVTDNFPKLLEMRDKKVKEKFDLMMQHLYDIGDTGLNEEILIVKCCLKDYAESRIYLNKALNENLINGKMHQIIFHYTGMTFDGLQYVENLESPNKSSKNVFLAFNFETELNDIFSTYVREAVEESGLNCIIVNQNNTEHDKAITDEIIGKLKSSRIVIADFTNHRNSVYSEAGFAMGMKIPIIWTVQKGHDNDMSFDTRQYPHIVWENGNDLKKQIMDRIRVII